MDIRTTRCPEFDSSIPANIALGEVHSNSGLEGAEQKRMDEQVKEWLTDSAFADFAREMGYPDLVEVSEQMESLQNLESLNGIGDDSFQSLIRKKLPMSLFYCRWQPLGDQSGHATNMSIAHNEDGTWDVSFHNIGLGLDEKTVTGKMKPTDCEKGWQVNQDQQMCPCAYTFSGLSDEDLQKLVKGILYIQKANNKSEYQRRCNDLYDGSISYKDESDELKTYTIKKPNDSIHNYTFMRAQVGGNCTYASLNAMMRYLVLRKYGALNKSTRDKSGKEASSAARVLDFYCRMKSMKLAFDSVDGSGANPEGTRFLERILEANICYFNKYIKGRYAANASKKLEQIGGEFAGYREKIRQMKLYCGKAASNSSSIREEALQNSSEITEALLSPAAKAPRGVQRAKDDTQLKEISTKLNEVRELVASGSPKDTRLAIVKLGELCSSYAIDKCENVYVEYIGNMIRSLILSEKFQVNIEEVLRIDENLSTRMLSPYYTIAKFLHALKEKNSSENLPGPGENFSPDERNVVLTLQAHTVQIFRELVKRRNGALRKAHAGAKELNPRELVIDVPKLEHADHCYDKQTVARRNELLKFSGDPEFNFVIGSENPEVPPSARDVFDSLLSGEDYKVLLDDYGNLIERIEVTSTTIKNSIVQIRNIRMAITKSQQKEFVLDNLIKAKKALLNQNQKSRLSSVADRTALAEIERKLENVKNWPDSSETQRLETQLGAKESYLRPLLHLYALQKAAQMEFFYGVCETGAEKVEFDNDKVCGLRFCTENRLIGSKKTRAKRRQQAIDEVNELLKGEPNGDESLACEFNAIIGTVKDILRKAATSGKTALQQSGCDIFPDYRTNLCVKSQIAPYIDTGIPNLDDIMTSAGVALPDTWGEGLIAIDREMKGLETHVKKSLSILRKIPQHGNAYAKTMAGIIGCSCTSQAESIFYEIEGFECTPFNKRLPNLTPYGVCGLGDLYEFVVFNEIFQSLQSSAPASTSFPCDMMNVIFSGRALALTKTNFLCDIRFISSGGNEGYQFAPLDMILEQRGFVDRRRSYKGKFYSPIAEAFRGVNLRSDLGESERTKLIAAQGSVDIRSELKKCNITDPNNPTGLVISVLAAISSAPFSFAKQLKSGDGPNSLEELVMGLLTSVTARNIISNGIKTEEDAKKLAEDCMNFLNKTWLESPVKLFDAGKGEESHILTYNEERLNALAVCVTAVTEVLTMLGQGDGIKAGTREKINQITQSTLEKILDSLNQNVLFQNVRNDTAGARRSRQEIAQLKLYLASQQSRLVGGPENLSEKWCANVIASIAEYGSKGENVSGHWQFSRHLISAELRRFCADFALGFSKHAERGEDNSFVQHTGLAARDIIKHSRQTVELTALELSANQKERTGINYGNDSDETVEWNARDMCFSQRVTSGDEEIICSLIDGASDLTKRDPSNDTLENLIEDVQLLVAVYEIFGIKRGEAVKAEFQASGAIKITPNSGLHKGEEFIVTTDVPPVFKRASGEQLVQVLPEAMKRYIFKKHFCWGIERGGKTYYEFFERAGGQRAAYCAIRQGDQVKFSMGELAGRQTIEQDQEICFIKIGDVPGLAQLDQDGLKLDGIFHKKDGLIELIALRHHGRPITLKKLGEKYVLASNSNMELISQSEFGDLLKGEGEQSSALGRVSIGGVENPMGGLWTKYLVFREKSSNFHTQNFLFVIPEEEQNKEEADKFFDKFFDQHRAKKAAGGEFGRLGKSEPAKLSLDDDALTVQAHFLRWSQSNVGRHGEFTIQESDSKAITRTALALIARAMREKNYTQALGFFNAIPNGMMLGKGDEDDAIRNMFFDIIRNDFDNTPMAAAMHMQLLLKWLQIDTAVELSICDFIKKGRNSGRIDRGFSEKIFIEIVKKKFVKAWRERAFYPEIFALTSLQKSALLEKVQIFHNYGLAEDWISQQRDVVGLFERNHPISVPEDVAVESVSTRSRADGDEVVSLGEAKAFSILRENFRSFDSRLRQIDASAEESQTRFSFLDEGQKPEGGCILTGEFKRYEQEVIVGQRKMLEDEKFIPANVMDEGDLGEIQKALNNCNSELLALQGGANTELQKLYRDIFSLQISQGTLSSDSMMPILMELMLNREKPVLSGSGGDVTLDFPVKKMRITMPRDRYESLLKATRTYLLSTTILQKNKLIASRLEDLMALKGKLKANSGDESLIVQIRAAYLVLNREIAEQQDLYTHTEGGGFYGKVAEAIGSGVTHDELLVYESLSGIRPYVKQAELLRKLFTNDLDAFQVQMGGGKTSVLVSMLCFAVSRQEKMSTPLILSHASQFESIVSSMKEFQSSRFGQDIVVLDVSRKQLRDSAQLRQILENLREAKKNRRVIIAKTSLLNVLQLTFQESCDCFGKISVLEREIKSVRDKISAVRNKQKEVSAEKGQLFTKSSKYAELEKREKKLEEEIRQYSVQILKLEKEKRRYGYDFSDDAKENFGLLRDVLEFFRTETTAIFDEADMNLNIMEEVNFPSGHEEPMSHTQRSAGASLFHHMATLNKSQDGLDLFGLARNEQATLSEKQFMEHQNMLAEHIWKQSISQDNPMSWGEFMERRKIGLEEFKKLLRGEEIGEKNPFKFEHSAPILGEDATAEHAQEREILERLAVFRGLLSELIPYTRGKSANRNYGFALREVPVLAKKGEPPRIERRPMFVPYVAVGQPSQNAFGNPYEKMACFFMHAMHDEVISEKSDTSLVFSEATGSARLLDMFFDRMRSKVELEKMLAAQGVHQSYTLESVFKGITGVEYSKFKESLEKRNLGQPEAYNTLIRVAQARLARSANARLLLFEYVSDEFLRSHPSMTTSGSMQVVKLVGRCVACSGTVWNHKTWPLPLDVRMEQARGTEGEIIVKQKQDFKAGRAHTFVSKDAGVSAVLDTIADQQDIQNFRALIDTGGIFKASNAEAVARRMIEWIANHNAKHASRQIDVNGVLFFKPHDSCAGGTYCIMSSTGMIQPLNGTTQDDIRNAGFDPDKVAFYYDEARAVGTDGKFCPTAFAIQTCDPSSTSMRDLLQGAMRMRGLLYAQRVHMVCSQQHLAAKRKVEEVSDGAKTDTSFTFEEALRWGVENQAAKLKKQLIKAYKARVSEVFKNVIFEIIQSKETEHGDACRIYGAFSSFFTREAQADVVKMFTANRVTRNGPNEVCSHMDSLFEAFKNICAENSGMPRIAEIWEAMQQKRQDGGEFSKILASAEEELSDENFEVSGNTFDVEVNQEQEQEVEVDQDQQVEVNQDQEQERESDIDLAFLENIGEPEARKETGIDVSIDPASPSFAHFRTFESVSAREDLRVVATGEPLIQNYGRLLPDNFHISKNFREVVEGNTHPFSPFRRNPVYFVLHVKDGGAYEFCVVSDMEAKSMRKNLNSDNTFLFDVNGTLLKGDPEQANQHENLRQDATNWINFWHGNIESLQSATSAWLDSNLRQRTPGNLNECSNHETCCFRWLLSCAKRRSMANGEAVDDAMREMHRLFRNVGIGSELQVEAERLLADLFGDPVDYEPKITTRPETLAAETPKATEQTKAAPEPAATTTTPAAAPKATEQTKAAPEPAVPPAATPKATEQIKAAPEPAVPPAATPKVERATRPTKPPKATEQTKAAPEPAARPITPAAPPETEPPTPPPAAAEPAAAPTVQLAALFPMAMKLAPMAMKLAPTAMKLAAAAVVSAMTVTIVSQTFAGWRRRR
jgi:hypothetical protein